MYLSAHFKSTDLARALGLIAEHPERADARATAEWMVRLG